MDLQYVKFKLGRARPSELLSLHSRVFVHMECAKTDGWAEREEATECCEPFLVGNLGDPRVEVRLSSKGLDEPGDHMQCPVCGRLFGGEELAYEILVDISVKKET